MPSDRIYLDYNATAPLLDEARDAMLDAFAHTGNPSSVHADGRSARALIDRARLDVAHLVNADPAHVTFTSGASEAACHVLTPEYRMGRTPLCVSRLYVSAIEHPCVLEGGRFNREDVTHLSVDRDGVIDLAGLRAALSSHDRATGVPMVAVMHANNESGVIQPVGEIGRIVEEAGGLFVVDAVQSAARLDVDISSMHADFLLLSAHKIGGPKGVGALVSAGEVLMPAPLVSGGGQEKGHRSGTENMIGIVGFGAAAHIQRENRGAFSEKAGAMRQKIETGIRGIAPDAIIISDGAQRLPNTTFFMFPGVKAETMQISFDLDGVSVSAGSACSSGKVGTSHVLKAMGLDAETGAIRVSGGAQTSESDVQRFLASFERIVMRRNLEAA